MKRVTQLAEKIDLRLYPYSFVDGKWTVDDPYIVDFFERVKKQRIHKKIIGQVENFSLPMFLSFIRDPSRVVVLIGDESKIHGMGWINDFCRNYIYGHFAFCREIWGPNACHCGKMLLDYWFGFPDENGSNLFDVIMGITPSSNLPAIAFISKIGFNILGEVPMICQDNATKGKESGYISYVSRTDFYKDFYSE